jgi:hypothetical protein
MKSLTKKITLAFSILLSVVLVLLVTAQNSFCYDASWCRAYWDDINNFGLYLFIAPIAILPFSLLTFWMKEEVFQKWFKFSLWYVPILVIAMFVFPTSVSGGLGIGGAYQEAFNTLVLILLFSIYIITSVIKIVRAHKKSKIAV